MPRPSATFTVWASAWLVGAAAPDDVLDALAPWADAHDVQAADELTAAATDLPPPGAPVSSLPFLLAALRRAAPRAPARLVLPAPGDVRGLPGPGAFSREATAAGEGVLFADVGLGRGAHARSPTAWSGGPSTACPSRGPRRSSSRCRTPSATCATRCAARRPC